MPSRQTGPHKKYVLDRQHIRCLIQYCCPLDSQALADRSWVTGLKGGLEFPNN